MTKKEKEKFNKVSSMLNDLEYSLNIITQDLINTKFELALCTRDFSNIRIVNVPFVHPTTKFALKRIGIDNLQQLMNTPIEDISEIIELSNELPTNIKNSRQIILADIEAALGGIEK